jgi:hypothetical protein
MKQQQLWLSTGIGFFLTITPVWGLNQSLSEAGVDALRLHQEPYNLQGRKISIGQVEVGRPKKFALDKVNPLHKKIPLARLFYRDQKAEPDNHIDNHAMMVAGVMVSNQKKLHGIAPKANLYSAALGSLKNVGQPEECLTTQNIARQNGGDMRAINFSFGESLERDERENPQLDGNALLTQCLDWSARVHDVLYVVAGNQGQGGIPIPTDNYNGITTAFSRQQDGIFRKVDFANLSVLPVGMGKTFIKQEINVGARRSISLLAPGNKIKVYNLDGAIEETTGSSFAAPHITGAVALLQEAGDRFLYQQRPLWSQNYRQHEVMKAILLNSADKIKDRGDGDLLGMSKTILTQKNQTWLESDAYFNPEIPLHMQMGTGHLNVMRAYQQLNSGEWDYRQSVPNQGWNYDKIDNNQVQEYIISKPLKADSFVAITLVWDRLVELQDNNNNQQYDLDEKFIDQGLNNLDLELIPVNHPKNHNSCQSISKVDSVEHIFCKIPQTAQYKIRVKFTEQVNQPIQPYALAWQTVSDH